MGIGRTIFYNEAMELGMQDAVVHFWDRSLHIESAMKTENGKALAREGTQRMEIFSQWCSEGKKVPKSYPLESADIRSVANGTNHRSEL